MTCHECGKSDEEATPDLTDPWDGFCLLCGALLDPITALAFALHECGAKVTFKPCTPKPPKVG